MAKHYLFSHLAGCCVVDEQAKILALERPGKEEELRSKFSELSELSSRKQPHLLRAGLEAVLPQARLKELRKRNTELTRRSIKEAVTPSSLVIQAVKAIDDLDRVINVLSKRLWDWYDLHSPEATQRIHDHQELARLITEDPAQEEGSFGAAFSHKDMLAVQGLAKQVLAMFAQREQLEEYIQKTLEKEARNLCVVAGPVVAARLLAQAGSLRQLAMMPSSTVQVLGAEKALFRHLTTGSRPPKYGVLFAHDIVQRAPKKQQGKAARLLADKIAVAVKLDLFKGEYQAEKLLQDLRRRLG